MATQGFEVMPNIGVVGSRTFSDTEMMEKAIQNLLWEKSWSWSQCTIVSGGAQGADTISKHIAECHDTRSITHEAQWALYGRSAGFRRNQDIVRDSDILLAFFGPEGETKGTAHTVSLAEKAGIPVLRYYQEKE